MCGIVGYVGTEDVAAEVVLRGLRLLEYRGYDSAGYALSGKNGSSILRKAQYRNSVELLGREKAVPATVGLGHTRWATHGEVNEDNTHPIEGRDGLVLVHNGTVENCERLRKQLMNEGYTFYTTTDTEVAVALLTNYVRAGCSLPLAMSNLAKTVTGSSTFVAFNPSEPGQLVCLKLGSAGGLVLTTRGSSTYLASDALALAPYHNQAFYLENGQICVARSGGLDFFDTALAPLSPMPVDTGAVEHKLDKGRYPHFMLKEIEEQPQAISRTLYARSDKNTGRVRLEELGVLTDHATDFKQVVLVGMGTSLNSCRLAALYMERYARLPAKAVEASEFSYGAPVVNAQTLIVAVTQSGETADTLKAIEVATKGGATVLAVVENRGTQATRFAAVSLLINAGFEQSVAATKTFTGTAVSLVQLVLALAQARGVLEDDTVSSLVDELHSLPSLLQDTLTMNSGLEGLAKRLVEVERMLYIGRGGLYPIAIEGALKMKEVAYVHAEAVSGGEMKHGINALIDAKTPGLALINGGVLRSKIMNNVSEYEARGGRVYKVAAKGTKADLHFAEAPELLEPLLAVVPLQQLAYHVAILRGNDPDRPRNLAKTVTVE